MSLINKPTEMRSRPTSQGFTIIEVLIVVAVMGFLIAAAIIFVAKDADKANFTTAINATKQQMELVISETANGYYPNSGNFTCTGDTTGATVPTFSSVSNGQGQNYSCVFLGKIIQFSPGGNIAQFAVMPVVGNNYTAGSGNTTVTLVSPVINWQYSLITQSFQYGLKISYMQATDTSGASHNDASVAFLAGDAAGNIASYTSSSSSGGLSSGAEPLSLYYDSSSTVGNSIASGVGGGMPTSGSNSLATDVSPSAQHTDLAVANNVIVCLTSGSQSGKIQIGGSGTLNVTLTVYNSNNCT